MYEILRFLRTIRFLKREQIYYRLLNRIPRRIKLPKPEYSKTQISKNFIDPCKREPSIIDDAKFRFMEIESEITTSTWNDVRYPKLWLYNLHYFDDLNSHGAETRALSYENLMKKWIKENSPGYGVGWEPYPTSLRIVNWIKWLLVNKKEFEHFNKSLFYQGYLLSKKLEFHILGNHLLANAKALLFLGLYFSGKQADGWLSLSLKIFNAQISEQILDDGGHFELSPMYHAIVLEDILDVLNIFNCFRNRLVLFETFNLENRLVFIAQKMLIWLKSMSHPDGKISFFNDACFNIAPSNSEILSYALRQNIKSLTKQDFYYFKSSGYVSVRKGKGFLIKDIAEIGSSYLPGHGHADSLSVEFSLSNQRVLVNSGISTYEKNSERISQRSTKAHNSVCVNLQNSSEVWSSFRVGRRAKVSCISVNNIKDVCRISGQHDGYRHINKDCIHHRVTELTIKNLTIKDEIGGSKDAIAFYYFHPLLVVEHSRDSGGSILLEGREICEWFTSSTQVELIKSKWHPEFGVACDNFALKISLENGQCNFSLKW